MFIAYFSCLESLIRGWTDRDWKFWEFEPNILFFLTVPAFLIQS